MNATVADCISARRLAAERQRANLLPGEPAITHETHRTRGWYPLPHQLPTGYVGQARMTGYGRREVVLYTPSGHTITATGHTELDAIQHALRAASSAGA